MYIGIIPLKSIEINLYEQEILSRVGIHLIYILKQSISINSKLGKLLIYIKLLVLKQFWDLIKTFFLDVSLLCFINYIFFFLL